MLADKDRIFTNVYGFQPWNLSSAQARGDWDGTKKLLERGQDAIKCIRLARAGAEDLCFTASSG